MCGSNLLQPIPSVIDSTLIFFGWFIGVLKQCRETRPRYLAIAWCPLHEASFCLQTCAVRRRVRTTHWRWGRRKLRTATALCACSRVSPESLIEAYWPLEQDTPQLPKFKSVAVPVRREMPNALTREYEQDSRQ